MGDITQEAKALVAALATTVQHQKTLSDLEENGLNLYQTLTPQHLGKAMATGLISWETMARWTLAQAGGSHVVGRGTPSCAPNAVQERQERPMTQHSQVQVQTHKICSWSKTKIMRT